MKANIVVPYGASDVTAVLAANGVDFQESARVPSAFQYWQTNVKNGQIDITRVREGRYRLTVYAKGPLALIYDRSLPS